MPEEVAIIGQTIDLDQFLKLSAAVGTGGEAKWMIQSGLVSVGGVVETRRRATLKPGDVVEIEGGGAWRVASSGTGSIHEE